MILRIYNKDVTTVREKLKSPNKVLENGRWNNPEQRTDINFARLSSAEVDAFEAIIKAAAEKGHKHYGPVYRKFTEWKSLLDGAHISKTPIKKLELLPAAIKAFYNDMPHKWLFQESDGSMNPYLIKDAKYVKAHYDSYGNYYPAHVDMEFVALKRGTQVSGKVTWYAQNLGVPVSDLFANQKLFPETEASVKKYQESFDRYQKLQMLVGIQMEAFGEAKIVNNDRYYWLRSNVSMVREGLPTKVILDDTVDEDNDSRSRRSDSDVFIIDKFWGEIPNRNGMANLDDEDMAEALEAQGDSGEPNRVELPVHPYIKVFDMDKHQYVIIHVENLDDYKWDKTLIDKLVINETDKELINLLMNQTGEKVEDIIRGKMSGVIVLATGKPGIGKTLTAEVFSEIIEKPLYTVQCSQLGLSVKSIEENLQSILNKAARWGAILLIDEADVYIRERGEDIEQNAIVGVFLRLIEYYRGILFMTSNRGEAIDDAIISRATAWIRYEMPNPGQLKQIWKVLGTQYGTEFAAKELEDLIKKIPDISGRTVRNLLKLAKMLVGDEKITVDRLVQVSKYQALN